MSDVLKAIALNHFPSAVIAIIVGFLDSEDERQNPIFYSLLIPALK